MSRLDVKGREVLDPTPMAMPVGFKRPENIREQIRRMIQDEFNTQMAGQGQETWEDSDDFDVDDDDPELHSSYELDDEMGKSSVREFIEEKPANTDPTPSKPDSGLEEPSAASQEPKKGKKGASKPPEPAVVQTHNPNGDEE